MIFLHHDSVYLNLDPFFISLEFCVGVVLPPYGVHQCRRNKLQVKQKQYFTTFQSDRGTIKKS